MTERTLSGKAAIAGIGATEFSKESGRSELQLSVEAVGHALADCGLTPADVDGLVTFTMDTSSEIAVARELGIPELRFFSRINYGGGAACATVCGVLVLLQAAVNRSETVRTETAAEIERFRLHRIVIAAPPCLRSLWR